MRTLLKVVDDVVYDSRYLSITLSEYETDILRCKPPPICDSVS